MLFEFLEASRITMVQWNEIFYKPLYYGIVISYVIDKQGLKDF